LGCRKSNKYYILLQFNNTGINLIFLRTKQTNHINVLNKIHCDSVKKYRMRRKITDMYSCRVLVYTHFILTNLINKKKLNFNKQKINLLF
jgi:hypothetical protein